MSLEEFASSLVDELGELINLLCDSDLEEGRLEVSLRRGGDDQIHFETSNLLDFS